MGEDLWKLGAGETAAKIAVREISSAEVIEAHLGRMDAVNPTLNAITRGLHDSARAAARDADAKVMNGDALGALHGVPITIKDNVDIAGQSSPNGLSAMKDLLAEMETNMQQTKNKCQKTKKQIK